MAVPGCWPCAAGKPAVSIEAQRPWLDGDAAMRGRFPPDLLVVVFGPLLVVAIALGLGSVIYRAAQFRGSVAPSVAVTAAACLLLVVALVLWRRRRRRS